MSSEISPEIQEAIDAVWSQYMVMMCLYGKQSVIDTLKNMKEPSDEQKKVRAALLPKLEKVQLK